MRDFVLDHVIGFSRYHLFTSSWFQFIFKQCEDILVFSQRTWQHFFFLSAANLLAGIRNIGNPHPSSEAILRRRKRESSSNWTEAYSRRFDVCGRPASTNRHVRLAVVQFEKWLKEGKHGDLRHIEDISPETLDGYLAEYFSGVRKQSGADYSVASFKSLRSCIEIYLKQVNYPLSITGSIEFAKSQMAFKGKKLLIMQNPTNSGPLWRRQEEKGQHLSSVTWDVASRWP